MKLKTRENNQKKYKNNFLNNQNYILGKREKKKVLTKFFLEFYNKYFFKVSSVFYKYGFLFIWIIIFLGIFLFIFFGGIGGFSNLGYDGFGFLILMLFLFYYLFNTILKRINDLKIFEVKNFETFILRKEKFSKFKGLSNWLFSTKYKIDESCNLLYGIIIPFIIFGFVAIVLSSYLFFVKVIVFFILLIIFDYISLISFLLLPILLGLNIIVLLYSLIYFFIIKGIKGYNVIKEKPQVKFLEKFKKISKNYAENKYYKIEIKN